MSEAETSIVGTYRQDFVVGKVFQNEQITSWGKTFQATILILRETTEQEWRERYNYTGEIPEMVFGGSPKFYEVRALD